MTSAGRLPRLPLLFLSVGVICVSVSALIARRALFEVTPLMLAAWRMGLASLFFLGVQGFQLSRRAGGAAAAPLKISRSERTRLAIAGIALGLHFILWFSSLRLTSVSISTLLVCTTPLWTALGQIALRRSSATPRFWAAFFVAIIGIALVIRPGGTPSVPGGASAHRQLIGDLLAVAGGAVFGVYLLAVDGLQHLSSSRIVAWTYTIAALLLWVIALAIGHPTLHYSAPVWEAIILLTVVPQIIGHTLINDALNSFQAHVVAFSILAEPVIAAALAVAMLHDIVTPLMLLGGLLVLSSLGFVLASKTQSRKPQSLEQAASL